VKLKQEQSTPKSTQRSIELDQLLLALFILITAVANDRQRDKSIDRYLAPSRLATLV